MRTKKGFALVEQAIAAVPKFTSVFTKLGNQGLELADVIGSLDCSTSKGTDHLERK